ncbi:ABC transporter ATP-binding protein [Fodinicola feengrottensis]|uniref:ABC transporter ATP-binding protein n=1 Tax=Fodinicola feengrottensis TaxID=435914 RepID=UPI0024428664|nr:ABC transporter ATP-binding protein [Fodinicola feengrottensis]
MTALDGFSLTVGKGEIVGLIGHNGAGKSTFVHAVTGLERADSGRIEVAGVDAVRHPRKARARIGVSPQETAFYPTVTVAAQLRLFGSLAGLSGFELRRQVASVAEELDLGSVLERRAAQLSGGQQRRTQAACALIGHPDVLLLDEPTVGADPETRRALLSAVRARAAAGAAVVYTTHYLPELVDLGASLAIVHGGRIVRRGSQSALLNGLPSHLRVGFDGPVPAALATSGELIDGQLDIVSLAPAQELASLLARGHVPAVVDIQRPSLDDLFHAIVEEARDAA